MMVLVKDPVALGSTALESITLCKELEKMLQKPEDHEKLCFA